MKALFILFISLFALNSAPVSVNYQDNHTIIATYNGVTEDYYFEFLDADGNSIIFHEISGDIDINLFEEESMGKSYKITWEDYTFEETDDDGETTGEEVAAKRIIALEEQV